MLTSHIITTFDVIFKHIFSSTPINYENDQNRSWKMGNVSESWNVRRAGPTILAERRSLLPQKQPRPVSRGPAADQKRREHLDGPLRLREQRRTGAVLLVGDGYLPRALHNRTVPRTRRLILAGGYLWLPTRLTALPQRHKQMLPVRSIYSTFFFLSI